MSRPKTPHERGNLAQLDKMRKKYKFELRSHITVGGAPHTLEQRMEHAGLKLEGNFGTVPFTARASRVWLFEKEKDLKRFKVYVGFEEV